MGERGPKPNWFREACADIIQQEKLVDFVGRVAAGKEIEQQVMVVRGTDGGRVEVVDVKCSTANRLLAFKMLAEWGVGKPTQFIANAPLDPEESKLRVDQMLELIREASKRAPIVVPDALTAKRMAETKTNGHANGENGGH